MRYLPQDPSDRAIREARAIRRRDALRRDAKLYAAKYRRRLPLSRRVEAFVGDLWHRHCITIVAVLGWSAYFGWIFTRSL